MKQTKAKRNCGSRPHCLKQAQAGDRFCAACRARINDIKQRCFPNAPAFNPTIPNTDAIDRTPTELALAIATYLAEHGKPVSGEHLQNAFSVSRDTVVKAAKIAREQNWLAVKKGPAGGYCAGAVAPPELAKDKAA